MPDNAGSAEADPTIEPVPEDFDEAAYLAAFADVSDAVRRGKIVSALEHYRLAGQMERRLEHPEYRALSRPLRSAEPRPGAKPGTPAASLEAVAVSKSGAIFIAGWADDRLTALTAIEAQLDDQSWSWSRFPRVRRSDVEAVLPAPGPYHYGFWLFGQRASGATPAAQPGVECTTTLHFANGSSAELRRAPMVATDAEVRDTAMGYLAGGTYHGNHVAETFVNLDRDVGDALIGFSRTISRSIVAGATVSRFGPQRPRYRASIIVPLYGIADYLFVQNCAYAQGNGAADHEFIYVVNSPELAEQLHREARITEMIYGLPVSLVMLPDNAGFGMANNVGVQFARSDRILCVNPDVFPRDPDWAQRHTDLLAALPAEQTRLFGTSLFYDDGSLMHGGMYFEADTGILSDSGRVTQRALLRVEHYGKGAPAWATQYVESRPVPAVTGAFMSIDRAWFEKLGGFTEDYVFGHYEDADLCLKSLRNGTPVWLHDIPMWHLEGKGSRRLPRHEGGSLINRWLFTRTWEATIMPDLIGRTPRLSAATPAQSTADPVRAPTRRAAAARPGTQARGTRIRPV